MNTGERPSWSDKELAINPHASYPFLQGVPPTQFVVLTTTDGMKYTCGLPDEKSWYALLTQHVKGQTLKTLGFNPSMGDRILSSPNVCQWIKNRILTKTYQKPIFSL